MAEDHERPKATGAPKCKICNTRHWGTCLDHSARGAIADQAPKAGSAAPRSRAGRAAAGDDSPSVVSPATSIAPSPSGKAAGFGPATAGSNPAGAAKAKKSAGPSTTQGNRAPAGKRARRAPKRSPRSHPIPDKLKELKKMADDASQRIADKPKRGRKPGPVPFNKKEHDRIKAAERRAAKKAGKP